MATENNWLTTNIKTRLTEPCVDFKVSAITTGDENISFVDASNSVCLKIKNRYNKIYVPLSGGMDSEYVFEQFKDIAIPIIVTTPGNIEERKTAFDICARYGITPVVIDKSEEEIIKIFYDEIVTKINGIGFNAVPAYVAAKYAADNDGIAVIAEHSYFGLNEWDVYNDALIEQDNSVYFFFYDEHITRSMYKAYPGGDHQIFKSELYKIPIRPKILYQYSDIFYKAIKVINQNRVCFPKTRDSIPIMG